MDSGRSPTPRRILIVDDDPVSLAIAAVLLEAEGCTVEQAESGERALEMLDDLNGDEEADADFSNDAFAEPHLILTDLQMPGVCGSELAAHLRAAAPHAVLLAMSASPPLAVDGYDGIVKKPLVAETIVAALGSRRMPPRPAVAAGEVNSGPVLDNAVFDRLRSAISAAALEEVIATFLNDTRARIQNMRNADAETVRREAHTVKGGAAMVGALQVSLSAAAVESGIDDPGARSRKLDEMEAHCHRAEIILKKRLEA